MSDFAQNGTICTLQRLNDSHLEALAAEWLPPFVQECPVSLILPCHASELERPALTHICAELGSAKWLHQVVVPINGLNAARFPEARAFFQSRLRTPHTLLWTDAPGLRQTLAQLAGCAPSELPAGKGLNVWAAIGWLRAQDAQGIFILQDADVASFRAHSLARLCLALADPALGFDFAKMYYSRVTDRLYGRVSRLFLAPLLHALIRVAGHHPLLDFLQSFRYPLSGECAIRAPLAYSLPLGHGWDLEIGMLAEAFRQVECSKVCQVDGGTGYDHKHQPAAENLAEMCRQIGATLLHQLAREGCQVDAAFLGSLSRAMRRESAEAVRRSGALARMNGLPCDPAEESATAGTFAGTLTSTLPPARVFLPAWDAVCRRQASALDQLRGSLG